jgi:hypothetical protein
MLTTWQHLPSKVGNHFADKWRSLGRYSLLADSDHGFFFYILIKNSSLCLNRAANVSCSDVNTKQLTWCLVAFCITCASRTNGEERNMFYAIFFLKDWVGITRWGGAVSIPVSYKYWRAQSHLTFFDPSIDVVTTNKLCGFSPWENYTDRATVPCRRSQCQLLRI